ncbi:uncharacterized protein LOC110062358 [Orbicella faveolata]|uniref:uncharacterized protein LOC110062358 n=1 Tax=Orbicella faveolata TaxID=48498 RepID=UPI0009E3A808|nr:uncharacterized protein LOC110062358 [Orbicella faveolata]
MKLEDCFTEHIKAHTASVFQKIEENVKILKEPDDSPAEQQSTSLFAVSSPQFITAVIIIAGLLLLACVLGIIYERCRKKTSKEFRLSQLGRTALDVGGGGDCFFRAVSHRLYVNPNSHFYVRSVGIHIE